MSFSPSASLFNALEISLICSSHGTCQSWYSSEWKVVGAICSSNALLSASRPLFTAMIFVGLSEATCSAVSVLNSVVVSRSGFGSTVSLSLAHGPSPEGSPVPSCCQVA